MNFHQLGKPPVHLLGTQGTPTKTFGQWWGETGRGKDWSKVRDLFEDDPRIQALLEFLDTTDLGSLAPKPAAEDAQSEGSLSVKTAALLST
jgi:hypothetical protein